MRSALATALLAASLMVTACSDDADAGPTTREVLTNLADDVIVPGYEELVGTLGALTSAIDDLCATPSPAALDDARTTWKDSDVAFRLTRAVGIGPATDRRLNSALGFLARPDQIDELLAGTDPVDADSLAAAGGGVKGLSALETALFAPEADTMTTSAGARRCEYATSVAAVATEDAAQVLTDWTDGYRDELVDSMDPQKALSMVVNELSHRLTELDDQGLRAMVEAASLDELPENRQDGPAAFRLAEMRALLTGIERVVNEGFGGPPHLDELVAARSPDTAERLALALSTAVNVMRSLPDSVTEAFQTPQVIATAQQAASDLDVLVATEVASQLGVTIGFSDADGDS